MKNKWLYLSGVGFSSLGDGFQTLAVTWLIYKLTGSAAAIGGMIAISYLPPMVLGPFAGVFVDHRDAKRLAVLVDLLRGAVVLLMTLMIAEDRFSLPLFYVLQGGLAVLNTLFKPASQAMVKETFQDRDLVFALTKSSTISQVLTLVGTGLVGVLAALPLYWFLAINALSFLCSALCNALTTQTLKRTVRPGKIEFWADLKGGWAFLVKKQGMLYLLFLSVISSISLQINASVMAPYVDRYLGGSTSLFSLLDVVFSLGGALAGLMVATFLARWGQKTGIFSLIGMGGCSVLAGFHFSVPLLVASIFGVGFFTMFHLVMTQTLIQVNTPKELIGCVVGLRSIVASLVKITTTLTATTLLGIFNIETIFWGYAGIVAVTLLTSGNVSRIPVPDSIRAAKM